MRADMTTRVFKSFQSPKDKFSCDTMKLFLRLLELSACFFPYPAFLPVCIHVNMYTVYAI